MRPCRPNTSHDGGSDCRTSSWLDHRRRKLSQHRHLHLVGKITDVVPEKELVYSVCLAQPTNLIGHLLARSLPHTANRHIIRRCVVGIIEKLQKPPLDIGALGAVSA